MCVGVCNKHRHAIDSSPLSYQAHVARSIAASTAAAAEGEKTVELHGHLCQKFRVVLFGPIPKRCDLIQQAGRDDAEL